MPKSKVLLSAEISPFSETQRNLWGTRWSEVNMVQVPDRLECLNALQPDGPFHPRVEKAVMDEVLMKSLVFFPMKTTSTTTKTIFNLIAAGSMLFAVSYQGWAQSTVLASTPAATPTKGKVLADTPTVPAPSGTIPATPTTPAGSSDLTTPSGTVPTTPTSPTGGGEMVAPKAPVGGSTTPIPKTPSTAKPSLKSNTAAAGSTVVGVASSSPQFKTLTTAIKAAGLETTLSGKGPFTVFAPTDEAFAALPPGVLDALLKPENKKQLAQLLTYHVVSGKLESKTLKSSEVPTLLGKPITIKVEGQQVTVNEAKVVQADIPATNGVIHVIDKVILPSN